MPAHHRRASGAAGAGGSAGTSPGGAGGIAGGGASGQGGTSGMGAQGGSAGAGGTSGAPPDDACNPITLDGCEAFGPGAACDQAQDRQGRFACFAPPNDGVLCGACDNTSGPFCGPGMKCLGGKCAQYCCQDFECGTGTCDLTGLEAWAVGVCKTVAGGSEPACDGSGPPNGQCFVQTGSSNLGRPLYADCIASNECESNFCARGVCSKVCGGQGGVFDTCEDPSPAQASGVTAACVVNPEIPCCRVQMTCMLACSSGSSCPAGTACTDGVCQ